MRLMAFEIQNIQEQHNATLVRGRVRCFIKIERIA